MTRREFAIFGLFGGLTAMLTGCAIAMPFRYIQEDAKDCAGVRFVSVTEARIKPDAVSRDIFWRNVRAVEASLPAQKGLIGYSLRQQPLGDTVWTMTVWADEASVVAFVYGGRHDTANSEASNATASMRFVRFTRACALGPPDWDEALKALAENGRSY